MIIRLYKDLRDFLSIFNYKEGTQTVTFGEAAEVASKENGSDLDCFTAPQGRQLLVAVFFVLCGSFPSAAPAALPGTAAYLHRTAQIVLCTGQPPPVRGILKAE